MEGYPSSAKSFSHSGFSEDGELYRGVREITPLARTLPARWPGTPTHLFFGIAVAAAVPRYRASNVRSMLSKNSFAR
jgi:hypothetical protein